MNETTTQIKDCSCGGKAVIQSYGSEETPIYRVFCPDCMKSVDGKRNELKEIVIERWNAMN